MISEDWIRELLSEVLEGTVAFLVDVQVKAGDKVFIEVDSSDGITLKDCEDFTRRLGERLEEEGENVALNISSPGLTQPFKVRQQYRKNVGKPLRVLTLDGVQREGVLRELKEDRFTLLVKKAEKNAKGKKKRTIEQEEVINFDQVKRAQVVLSF